MRDWVRPCSHLFHHCRSLNAQIHRGNIRDPVSRIFPPHPSAASHLRIHQFGLKRSDSYDPLYTPARIRTHARRTRGRLDPVYGRALYCGRTDIVCPPRFPSVHRTDLLRQYDLPGDGEPLAPDTSLTAAGPPTLTFPLSAERIPERLWPGRFDILGASHQIFHFCVVAAALCHYKGLLESVRYVHGVAGGRCPWDIGNEW